MEGLIFGGAYVRKEICVSNSIGLACSGKEIGHFYFALLCIRGQILSTSLPGGLYLEGLVHARAYFRNFTVIGSPMEGNPRLDSIQWIPDSRYCIPVFVSGTWILDSNR